MATTATTKAVDGEAVVFDPAARMPLMEVDVPTVLRDTKKGAKADAPKDVPDSAAGLATMEEAFRRGHEDAIAALRVIRDKRLYRHEEYTSFVAYMEAKWHRSPQWASQEFQRLRFLEVFKARTGKDAYRIPKEWALQLVRLHREQKDVVTTRDHVQTAADDQTTADDMVNAFLEVVERERRRGRATEDDVKEVVNRRMRFRELASELRADPPLQLKEYVLLDELKGAAAKRYVEESYDWPQDVNNAVDKTPTLEGLEAAARKYRRLPHPGRLLRHWRCDDLERAVLLCVGLVRTWQAEDSTADKQQDIADKVAFWRPAEQKKHPGPPTDLQFRFAVDVLMQALPDKEAKVKAVAAALRTCRLYLDAHK